uniref:Uncharacterized protein n=1 Tax=Triticum urartu TaxID=4572 RepID=A0A8R7R4J5_TRIUA
SRHHCNGNNLAEDARRRISPPGAAETTATTRRSSERSSARLSVAQPHHAVEMALRSSPSNGDNRRRPDAQHCADLDATA